MQEESKGDFETASLRSTERLKNEDLKQKVNTPDKLTKAPLMLNYDVFDDEGVQTKEQMRKGSNPSTPMRRIPTQCAVSMGKSQGGKSKIGNALKI